MIKTFEDMVCELPTDRLLHINKRIQVELNTRDDCPVKFFDLSKIPEGEVFETNETTHRKAEQ